MSNNDDLFTFDLPTSEPRQGVTLHPEPPTRPVPTTVPLPTQPSPPRRAFNWWMVTTMVLMLFIGIYLVRHHLPSGGGGSEVDGLHVLIVYKSKDLDKLPSKQAAILTSVRLREWLDENCADLGDGQRAFRAFDQNAPLSMDDPGYAVWRSLMKSERDSLPWIYAVGGRREVSAPLPADVDATITLLEGAK